MSVSTPHLGARTRRASRCGSSVLAGSAVGKAGQAREGLTQPPFGPRRESLLVTASYDEKTEADNHMLLCVLWVRNIHSTTKQKAGVLLRAAQQQHSPFIIQEYGGIPCYVRPTNTPLDPCDSSAGSEAARVSDRESV